MTMMLVCLLLVFGCCVVSVGHCFCVVVMRSCCTWSVALFPHTKFPANYWVCQSLSCSNPKKKETQRSTKKTMNYLSIDLEVTKIIVTIR
jgi:hypothetical protein